MSDSIVFQVDTYGTAEVGVIARRAVVTQDGTLIDSIARRWEKPTDRFGQAFSSATNAVDFPVVTCGDAAVIFDEFTTFFETWRDRINLFIDEAGQCHYGLVAKLEAAMRTH